MIRDKLTRRKYHATKGSSAHRHSNCKAPLVLEVIQRNDYGGYEDEAHSDTHADALKNKCLAQLFFACNGQQKETGLHRKWVGN